MFLRALYLRNFRCYEEACFEFSEGINAVIGPNAQGKTSILEAIHLLSTGRSFRTARLLDCIRQGEPFFHLEAIFVKHGLEHNLKVIYSPQERKIVYNKTTCRSWNDLLGLLPNVVITPDDVALVKGSPSGRRQFLDLQIAQGDPLYVHHLTRYHRAMKQRNALLRLKQQGALDSWEEQMAISAAYLVQQRAKVMAELESLGRELHLTLTQEIGELKLAYKASASQATLVELKNQFVQQYKRLRSREILLGTTLTGPHKEDFTIAIGDKEARYFASEGQQRSCVNALRLAEWQRLNQVADQPPLMLIDDIALCLDANRRERLFDLLPSLSQVFLTTTTDFFTTEAMRPVRVYETRAKIVPVSVPELKSCP